MNQWSSISGKAAPEIPMHILAIKSVNQKILGAKSEMEGDNKRIKVANRSYADEQSSILRLYVDARKACILSCLRMKNSLPNNLHYFMVWPLMSNEVFGLALLGQNMVIHSWLIFRVLNTS